MANWPPPPTQPYPTPPSTSLLTIDHQWQWCLYCAVRQQCVVLAAVHPGSLLTPLTSVPAGYRDNYILSSYCSSLPALTRLLLAAITPAKWGLWSLASYALYGCLGRQWGDADPPSSISLNCISPYPPFFPHTYIYLAESGPSPPRPPLSCSVMDGEAQELTLALWGLLCHSPLLSEIPVCLSDSFLLIVLSAFVWTVPLSECPMNRANDAYWELLPNEEQFVSPQLEAVSQTQRAGAMETSLKYMFDMRWQQTSVTDIMNIQFDVKFPIIYLRRYMVVTKITHSVSCINKQVTCW